MRTPYIRRYPVGYNLLWATVKLAEALIEFLLLGQVGLGWTTDLALWKAKQDMMQIKLRRFSGENK